MFTYTYLISFQYTKNCHLFPFNKVFTLDHQFGVDDIEVIEAKAKKETGQRTWIMGINEIQPSQKEPQ